MNFGAHEPKNFASAYENFFRLLSHFIPHTKWKDLLKQNMVVVGFHGSKFTFDSMVFEPKCIPQ
jgi:hypothetical protein